MDVALISPRSAGTPPHPAHGFVASLSRALVDEGHAVRWLRPVVAGESTVDVDGVRVIDAPTRRVPFRSVVHRLSDLPTERALSSAFRDAPPDIAHVHGFGGASSYMVPWLAERLGVPVVVVADPIAESLCHRRTLVDEKGHDCGAWTSPERCAACCRAPGTDDGLGRGQALVASLLRPLGGRSPFPSPVDFHNRLDMVAQGLTSARIVCVADEIAAGAAVRLGVSRRTLRVGVPDPDAAEWMSIYRAARGTEPR